LPSIRNSSSGRSPSAMPRTLERPAVCPRCGARFGCGVDTGACWCAAEPLEPDARARAAEAGDGCLCPACLEAVRNA